MAREKGVAAVVLAAGRSTRFRTRGSKLLHPLAGRPLIAWPLKALEDCGIAPLVAVVNDAGGGVAAACGPSVLLAVQKEPRGTGHALRCGLSALAGFRGTLLLVNGDLPLIEADTIRRLLDLHRTRRAALTLATTELDDPTGWGRIRRRRGKVVAIVEEADASAAVKRTREVNVGLYCLETAFLRQAIRRLRADNEQGELYVTDLVALAAGSRLTVADLRIDPQESVQVNTRADWARAARIVRRRINDRWMAEGVTLEDPESTYIDVDVQIGQDTWIGPNVQLRGTTRIGRGCRIDGTALLSDATIGDETHLKLGVVVSEASIGQGCSVGPFAHIRPGTVLEECVRIGNFVETKKALIGARSKASHLSYLGDAEIGEDTNIGAGVITCNYDGFRKHRTVIGNRVQVGSDSQLVAPVTLEDDVYVATGTTVRHDVAAGSLVFNRKEEKVRPGWVAARRAREVGTETPASAPPPRRRRRASS